jgi:hypothetical protein
MHADQTQHARQQRDTAVDGKPFQGIQSEFRHEGRKRDTYILGSLFSALGRTTFAL